jgi:prefoldin subunit 5
MSSSDEPKPQEIFAKFQSMKMEIQSLAMKIGSLEREKEEHRCAQFRVLVR